MNVVSWTKSEEITQKLLGKMLNCPVNGMSDEQTTEIS